MSEITVMGLDPSIRHTGICVGRLILPQRRVIIDDLALIDTEKRSGKDVRQNSDDLRRAEEILAQIEARVAKHKVAFAISEVPTGAQSARAAWMLGMAVATLAALKLMRVPLIQVQPNETKLASVGSKTATKQQIIDWAYGKYPDLPWLTHRASKHPLKLTADNEHMADAIAVVHAGIETAQFQQAVALAFGMARAA